MSSPAWPTYDDWCAEVKHVKESWKTEHKGPLERDGDLIVTTEFGSQWSVDSWASHLLAIGGENCQKWFNERDHKLRLSWYRPLRDQDGSMDIYSSKFVSTTMALPELPMQMPHNLIRAFISRSLVSKG